MNMPRSIPYLWRMAPSPQFGQAVAKMHDGKWRPAQRCWRRAVSALLNSQLVGTLKRGKAMALAEKQAIDILWPLAQTLPKCPRCK